MLVLYDVTSSYLEGRRCELAQFGYSRDHRRDRPQIVFGLLCANSEAIRPGISPDLRRGKAVDNGGLRYGAMESALRPPLPTVTRAFAEIQIQARLTNCSGQNIITSIRRSRRQVADIKSEPWPASNRNWWPASYRNA